MSNDDWTLYFSNIPALDTKIDASPITQKNFAVSMGSLKTINSNISSRVNFSPGTEKQGKFEKIHVVESWKGLFVLEVYLLRHEVTKFGVEIIECYWNNEDNWSLATNFLMSH